jgi:glycosyltransferase involved in cell wall biosynthesis
MAELDLGESSYRLGSQETRPLVVVGIPAFNEEKTIAKVVLRAQQFSGKVVVCDDGSADSTCEIAKHMGAEVIRHQRNLGYGAAIQTLFSYARKLDADVLVTVDADGQHDPREIPEVVKPIVNGSADIAIGSRFVNGRLARSMPWYRRAGVKFITKLVNNGAHGQHGVNDAQSGFRAYSHKALEILEVSEDGMGVSVEALINAKKHGLRICEVSSSCNYCNDGVETSTHNPMRHGAGVMMVIVRLLVEEKPLRLLGIPGMTFLLIGAIFGVWMLQIYGIEHRIVTNIALASITFVLIGFFLLSTAITLYAISRIAERVKGEKQGSAV